MVGESVGALAGCCEFCVYLGVFVTVAVLVGAGLVELLLGVCEAGLELFGGGSCPLGAALGVSGVLCGRMG